MLYKSRFSEKINRFGGYFEVIVTMQEGRSGSEYISEGNTIDGIYLVKSRDLIFLEQK